MSSKEELSLGEVHGSIDTTKHKKGIRRFLAYIGPAYLVSVGYMDPGNWATDLQGGARFGYKLIWILLMSNIIALLLQSLSARLGIVRRRDLAQANREMYPPVVNFCLYILAEIAIAATDLAEVLGMAIGLHLLTGIPLLWGVSITVLDTFIILFLQRYGMRLMEAFIIALVAIIGISFLVQIIIANPDMAEVSKGFVPSSLSNAELYIAIGIIGATVMPHNLYLHSALVQTRKIGSDHLSVKKAIHYNIIDSAIALNAAFFVNAGILILAATAFFKTGNTAVAKIEDAHSLLQPLLGTELAPILFAVALIAAGQSSTVTGTLAGQIVMEGYLRLRINPWLRRLITRLVAVVPAFLVILIYGEDEVDALLVFSQVVLSLQLGFAIIPLLHFVSDKQTMGAFAIRLYVKIAGWLIAGLLVFLNARLVVEESLPVFHESGNVITKLLIIVAAIAFLWLFCIMTFYPWIRKKRIEKNIRMHGEMQPWAGLQISAYTIIAVALDFSKHDEKLIAHAVSQGTKATKFVLLHIIESPSAVYLGKATDDYESRNDQQRLDFYAEKLTQQGYTVEVVLGHKNRIKEIVRIVKEHHADMLILGAHRHRGLFDFIYGQTVNEVRHHLDIPVLIIN